MKKLLLIVFVFLLGNQIITAQTIDFESESFVEGSDFGSAVYTSGNIRLTYSSGNFFEDTDNGFGNSNGLALLNFTSNETLTIETIDGSEIDFQSFYLTNFFGNAASIEGFRDGGSTGTQTNGFPAPGLTGVVTFNNNFDNVDRAVVTFAGGAFDVVDQFVFAAATSNTPPTASSFTASNGPFEDLTYTFSTADFGYSDSDSDPLNSIVIELVPPVGTLYVDADNGDDFDAGEQLTNGSIVSKANLDAGNLQYIQNGSVNTSFQFEVNDGNVNSSSNYVATLNVTAIPTVTLSIDDPSDLESTTSNNTVTATLSNTYGANTIVNLSFIGTAINTTDYTRSANSITINAGTIDGSINLNNVSDALDENDETVIVDITGVTNGAESGTQQVTYTILDDDSTPTLSISDPTIGEGNSGSTNVTFTISLSTASGKTVTVNYATSDNTATIADGDYNQVTTAGVTFLPGETSKMITVGVNGDAKVEADESFFVNLSTPFNATISDGQGAGTITNNDQATVTIADVALNENSGTATITVIVDNAVDGGFDVDVSTADGTATTADSDYTAVTAQTLTFAGTAGESETFNITLGGDTKVEADETTSISMSGLSPGTVASGDIDVTDGATLTINNDDQATVTIANVSGNEDDGAITVTVIVDNAIDGGFDVDVSTADGTATTANSDYTAVTAQTLTFAGTAGESETFTITPTADATSEPDETVIIGMSGLSPSTVASGDINITDGATLTIFNDDDISISVNDPSIDEGNTGTTTLQFTVNLNAPAPAGGATVDYATSNGSATAGSDYTAISTTTLSFLAGESSKTVDITITGDQTVEIDETLTLTLSNPTGTNVIIGDSTGTGTITNDDQATVTIADVALNENSGTATITVIVDNAVDGGFDVDVSTADGTATTADSDYTAVTAQTLTFAGTAGESETFNITLGGDTKVEADETTSISMSGLSPGTVASGDIDVTDGATLTINNDDQATVTIANVSGNEDDGAITVTVIVDNAIDGGFDVDVSTADGTATTANSDYTAVTAQTLTFAGTAGETETFTITPTADATSEPDETVIIGMSGLSPSTVASGDINITDGATLTIFNDDDISISVNDPSIAEGNSGTTTLQFTVNLNAPAPAGGATVDYATSNGSATAGSDYTAISTTTLSFLAGESSKTVDITISGDQTVEIDETLTLTLSNPTGTDVIIGDATGTGTITNDDQATVTIADVAVNENSGTATITVIVDNAVDGGFDVDVSTADGTATTADSDYTAVTAQTLTFAGTAGESETFNITLGGDTKVEADETASISMSGLSPGTVASGDIDVTDGATLTINNDDQATVTIANVSGNEDNGAITVTVIVDNAIDGGFDVDVSTADGTATTVNSDYTAVTAQTLTFAGTAGETETFTITPTADATSEPDETVIIGMSGLSPATVASGDIDITDGATLTILNDDAAVLSIVATTQAAENTTNGLFTISTTNQFSTPVTVNLSVTGTATSGTDFTALGTTFIFPANTNSATINVPVIADNLVESNETVIVTLTGTNNGIVAIGSADNATVTITDDDVALLSITATTQAEEGTTNGVYTVSTTNEFSTPVMVTISTTGTAISGTDYDDLGSSFMFPANTSSMTIPLSVIDDNIVELDETVILTMTNTNNTSATIGTTDEATITITDPDIATITIEDVNANEDDGAITIIATLDNEVPGGFTVDVNTTDGTATIDDNDYTAIINQTLSFTGNAGEKQTFTILPTEDATPESDETVTVTLSNLANTSLEINSTDSALITILNDDDLDIRVYPNPTAGEVNINIPLNLVLVYNVTGKKVFETKNNSFSIADLPSGIYFIRIKTINGSIERKLIKL
ncbi:Calx-beta domain-containing protein [Aquimarina algiphila]|uniref:Calx-beta domain-containing protein n=2 Tax=Aquimarina algiphila TaxID=2047982 RepID=UPI0023303571|nr:Calx-beta domain-containing protein [Aquimarina algiphila]